MIPIQVGDKVRVRTTPEVEPRLWDHVGQVMALRPNAIVVELDTGADCALLPDQIEPVPNPIPPDDPFARW